MGSRRENIILIGLIIAAACAYVALQTYAKQSPVSGDIVELEQAMDDLLHTAHDPQFYDDVDFQDGTFSTLSEADHGAIQRS